MMRMIGGGRTTMTVMKTTVRNGRIDVPAPNGLLDGTEVLLTIGTNLSEEESVPLEEIARILTAMQQLEPLDIPDEVADDLDTWERELNQRGVDQPDKGIENGRAGNRDGSKPR
jgi:hypothetical protein